eukprot:206133-Rhodomonas_salina.1
MSRAELLAQQLDGTGGDRPCRRESGRREGGRRVGTRWRCCRRRGFCCGGPESVRQAHVSLVAAKVEG